MILQLLHSRTHSNRGNWLRQINLNLGHNDGRFIYNQSAPSHYLNQCWVIVNWTLWNKVQWNFNQNTKLFIHENAFENIVRKLAAIVFWLQCVKENLLACDNIMTWLECGSPNITFIFTSYLSFIRKAQKKPTLDGTMFGLFHLYNGVITSRCWWKGNWWHAYT